ncbi:MAG: sugar nucleotide-binding protein [Deltaproteobacteria bacterium]|nr:MAG: sugar nucleotide-binding protein [Deltaproteobacteria bacterium]
MSLDLERAFAGHEILITGVTGFLGKVALTMLLDRYPDVGRIYVLVRPRAGGTAEDRFFGKVAGTQPFRPLRERHGDGFEAFLRKKCVALAGDVTDSMLGLSEEQVKELTAKLACVINSAGLVTFNPSLELAVRVNTEGARNAAELCKRTGATLVHISTCFVAGTRRGPVFEDEPLIGSYPKAHDLDEAARVPFVVDAELKDVDAVVARLRAQADDGTLAAQFRAAAVQRLEEEGRDPADQKALGLASGRERKLWLAQQLVQAGMERARAWGWPNTYTYTKAMGEQAIAASGCQYALVRPAIVESALRFPFPGWNEGFTTSAPLVFMGLKGQRVFPAGHKLVLDLIPVDLVAAGILGVAGAACAGRLQQRVFQLASGDVNPFYVRRSVELVALYKRRKMDERVAEGKRSAFENWIDTFLEPYPASKELYFASSAPLFRAAAKGLRKLIAERGASWGAPRTTALLARADQALEGVDRQLAALEMTWDLFLPFVAGERFIFQCKHTRQLWAQLSEDDRAKLPWDPEAIDWRRYWMEVHMRGLEEWVFPGLEEETKALKREVSQPKDLLALLAAARHAFGPRVALRFYAGEDSASELARTRDDHITYDELARFSDRAGRALQSAGIKAGDRVLLMSENRPEWAMGYFGILKAGAAAAPLDQGLSAQEVQNCAAAAKAPLLLASPKVVERLRALPGLRTLTLPDVLRGSDEAGLPPLRRSAAADDVASVLFTSGTTGKPKGVVLTHRNFASLAAKIAGLFDLRVGEGVLSVLPLHHTFEFSCGLLVPLMLGAEITYLDELTADRLSDALNTGRIHALIGVPALWQLLHRRLTQELASRPRAVEAAIQAAMALHGELRNRTPFNVGKLLFWPIHNRFGGKLRLLVSGGSALPEEVQKAFHELGFDLTEGYGLTEAAPVLSVTMPENRLRTGTVGPPLPGVEIRIENPDADGVGEVLAKGPNVMAGYLDDPEATREVLAGGWLRTGDLGRVDEDGHLTLVGRKKDLILDASGKNVYPDELEEIYGASPRIKELSIVGLPDGKGHERVACLCVPAAREDRAKVEEHFARISAELPFGKRVKVLHFWDGDLPKTATRKVKRPLVVAELLRLEKATAAATQLATEPAGSDAWLYDLLADLAQKPRGSVNAQTRLVADLGFDSLLVAELTVALEKAGVKPPPESESATITTAGELARRIEKRGDNGAHERDGTLAQKKDDDIFIPGPVAAAGRAAISFFQKALYGGVFEIDVSGQANVPANGAFLVAANHTSHLDVGLVKIALRDEGTKLASLAARDYFFDNPWKRAWFGNFTNLVPIQRRGSLKESLHTAVRTLELGYHLLIFPEGTRSPDGELQEFKPAIAYLSFAAGADILPVYLEGTHEAMPKGAFLPDPRKRRNLIVRIGPVLRYEELRGATQGLARSAAHKEVTRLVRLSIEALRDGKPPPEIGRPGRLLEASR